MAKKPIRKKRISPPVFTDEEIKAMLKEIGIKHRALNKNIFEKENFRAKIVGDTIVFLSRSAKSTLFNGKRQENMRVVFENTSENTIKHGYPEYYEKVTDIHKAVMTDIAAIWQVY